MFWAIFNDVFQRIVSFNKQEQKKQVSSLLKSLNISQGKKVLDFGCGTGLFSNTIRKCNLDYYGYDIDSRLIAYARSLYKKCNFTASKDDLGSYAPFDVVIANCCFHHINDNSLTRELDTISTLLANDGTFIMIDLLLPENDNYPLRKLFRKLEQGAFIRSLNDYKEILEQKFYIVDHDIKRTHLFSAKYSTVYNDIAVLTCKKATDQ